jgi:hypothetical protein
MIMAVREQQGNDPRIDIALDELRAVIAARYPTATFDVFERDDPMGVRLRVVVNVEDTDEVMDLVIDQLTEIQTERALPVYLLIEQPLERVAEQLHRGTSGMFEPLSALFR